MSKDILEILNRPSLDPDYLAAKIKTRQLVGTIKASTDPLIKKVVFAEGNDTIDSQARAFLRAQAKKEVDRIQRPTTKNFSLN